MAQRSVTVGIGPVSFDELAAVARHDAKIVIATEAWAEVAKSREIIEALADDQEPHYGVSTGFGALATRHIPIDLRGQLQRSLVRSHAAGSGPEVEREVVRALMLLRISTLATGRTGIREQTLRCYVAMVNAGLTPVVYEYGSLGCSGDLAPLAHCALALMGEGIVRNATGTLMPTGEAFAAAGIAPVTLCEKEGLALINGTDGMLGMLVLAIIDLRRLLKVADITAAMSVEGLLGTDDVFADDLHGIYARSLQAARSGRATIPRPVPESRTPTRCAVRRRWPAPYATPLIMLSGSP
jgi:histidine ammonia-lyase